MATAPGPVLFVPPATVTKMMDEAAVRPSALFASSFGALETDDG
jgi:hypothetical protein